MTTQSRLIIGRNSIGNIWPQSRREPGQWPPGDVLSADLSRGYMSSCPAPHSRSSQGSSH